jgi:hypothetical protein
MGNIYTEPGSSSVHITDINNVRSDLYENLDKCQLGIETDNLVIAYKDHNGDYHTCAAFVNGMIQISPNFALFENADGNLGIKKLIGGTWTDTGNVLA